MKNKRLYAILLLAALALLQVRVAFAACLMGTEGPVTIAACCGGQDFGGRAVQPIGTEAVACADHCIKAAAQEADRPALLAAQFKAPAPPRSFATFLDPPADARLLASVTPSHPAHTRLIYVFQRLLI